MEVLKSEQNNTRDQELGRIASVLVDLINILTLERNYEPILQRYQGRYEKLADLYGTSVEDVQMVLQRNVEQAVESSNFFRAIGSSTLRSILWQDGRFKSLFETGRSRGINDDYGRMVYDRSVAEYNLFGYNQDMDPSDRPIYGYFSDAPNGEVNSEGVVPPVSAVKYYGEVAVRVKRDIAISRATVTFADQLDGGNRAVPSPAARPHFASLPVPADYTIRPIQTSRPDWGPQYTEAQFHGGLHIRDIDQIHMSTSNGSTPYEIDSMRRSVDQYYERTGVMIPVIEY